MQQRDYDLVRGWQAAEASDPFDPHETDAWREGYRLYEARAVCRQRYAVLTASPASLSVH